MLGDFSVDSSFAMAGGRNFLVRKGKKYLSLSISDKIKRRLVKLLAVSYMLSSEKYFHFLLRCFYLNVFNILK